MFYSRELIPLDETYTLAEAVDWNAKHNPDLPFFVFSKDQTPDEVTSITHSAFARACRRVAHAVRDPSLSSPPEVVAIIAHLDTIAYQALVIGLTLAGHMPFPISPRNSPAAVLNLLEKTSCRRLITTQSTLKPLLDGIDSQLAETHSPFGLQVEEAPEVLSIFPELGGKSAERLLPLWPHPVVRPKAEDICLYLHSSGSTGFPKPIPLTHKNIVQWGAILGHVRHTHITFACMALPPFHALGVFIETMYPVFHQLTIAVYPPCVFSKGQLPMIPSPDNIIEHVRRINPDALVIVPAFLQAWARSPSAISVLNSLKYVYFAGGPLAPKTGQDFVRAGVNVRTIYGGTEFGGVTVFRTVQSTEDDWDWFEFNETVPIRWVPQGDGTFELQLLTSPTYEPSVKNIPDVEGYATSDVFVRHPTNPRLWKIVGRIDDVIIHSSGEKTVPAPMENTILSSQWVEAVVLFGREHDFVGVLVEPREAVNPFNPRELDDFIDKIWPVIEEANQKAPASSRIYKSMIIVTSPDKPMTRAGKSTIQREASLKLYEQEINQMFEAVESTAKGSKSTSVKGPDEWTKEGVTTWLVEQLRDIYPEKKFSIAIDFFEQGLDSLGATFLRQRLLATIRDYDELCQRIDSKITESTVYDHPQIDRLAGYIATLVENPDGEAINDIHGEMEAMIAKYSLPGAHVANGTVNGVNSVATGFANGANGVHSPPALTVLLTGSTGNLGSHLLDQLLRDDRVGRVYSLNRPSSKSSLERLLERFTDQGLDLKLVDATKLVFLEGDTARPYLGLDETQFTEVRNSIDVIIHNAWKLDFNQGLSSFEPNIRGVRHLIDLARSSPRSSHIRFVFTSSIASTMGWDKSKGPFPEEHIEDLTVAMGGGYGAAKYVAERILLTSGLDALSLRLGQLTGGRSNERGAWATTDWVPILVKSSITLGALPAAPGVISWLPLDAVASHALDVAFAPKASPALNVVHPRPISWNDAINDINVALVDQGVVSEELNLIPFDKWVERLERRSADKSEQNFRKLPAIKLLPFYRQMAQSGTDVGPEDESGGIPQLTLEKSCRISPTLRDLKPLTKKDAERWVEYWKAVGYMGL
ncbi:acetyl-CoA synthetase-like protein [Pluteus cervinus]|uniref:Acetyl-CoA synthetase-like protein n=1 Tax=Pluteus cervinus TaxID=181527 RepID=A0ACD3B945_9AGAR|nr:acetyl-CoA synthetase-like protein [Pluteus cervinus]